MRPLAGVLVMSLEQAVAAPLATRQLADLGARVIKVERPGTGDFARHYDTTVEGESSYFVWANRSKESLTLNLKNPDALRILTSLLGIADVFVYNLAPGAIERLGLDTVRESNSRLITCAVTGYGPNGPFRDRKAYDLLVQAEAGLMSITGTSEAPARVGISVADIAAAMYAYSGILVALMQRDKTGAGTHVEVSLLDALSEWMTQPAYYATYGGTEPPRSGPFHASIAPYGPVSTKSGDTLMIGVQNVREWQRFCTDVLGRPDLTDDPRFRTNPLRVEHRSQLQSILDGAFATLTTQAAIERLEAAKIAFAEVRRAGQLLTHPQLSARDRWRQVPVGKASVQALRPPASIDGVDDRMDAVPGLGQHTESILSRLGYGQLEVDRLRSTGAI